MVSLAQVDVRGPHDAIGVIIIETVNAEGRAVSRIQTRTERAVNDPGIINCLNRTGKVSLGLCVI